MIGTVVYHETPFSGYQIRLFVGNSNASRNLPIDSRGEAIRPRTRHVTLPATLHDEATSLAIISTKRTKPI